MKICNNCKQTNPPEAMFCRQCASPLNGGQQQQQQQQYGNQQQNQFGQQQWNQANYGNQNVQQQNFGQNVSGGASSRATTSAILAVVGLLCCGFITGIPAAILGWLEIQAIKEGKSSPAGMTMAQIGLWLGIAGTVINAILTFFFLILGSLGGGGGY